MSAAAFNFDVDEGTGEVRRSVPLTGEARGELGKALVVQREKFIAKFGREPGPDDPIFFDMDEDQARDDIANAMREAGVAPALIYAYEETGLIVTTENRRMIPDVELREFDAKVREYYDCFPRTIQRSAEPCRLDPTQSWRERCRWLPRA